MDTSHILALLLESLQSFWKAGDLPKELGP